MLIKLLNLKRLFLKDLFFICVACSRCLYKTNVKKGNEKDYSDLFLSVNTGLISCDKEYDICFTCQNSLKKNNIRCQSVVNNLLQSEIPKEISALNILEKVLIGQRLLLKKIVILLKGQFLSCAAVNMPVDVNNLFKKLPFIYSLILLRSKKKF